MNNEWLENSLKGAWNLSNRKTQKFIRLSFFKQTGYFKINKKKWIKLKKKAWIMNNRKFITNDIKTLANHTPVNPLDYSALN